MANSPHITALPGSGRGTGRGVAFPPLGTGISAYICTVEEEIGQYSWVTVSQIGQNLGPIQKTNNK